MNTNTTLELRQLDSTHVYSNGDYTCKLGADITINQGDQIFVKQVYLDNKDESVLFFKDDITLEIKNVVYITDWLVTADKTFVNDSGTAFTSNTTCGRYIPYKRVGPIEIPNGYVNIINYKYNIDIPEGSTFPGIPLSYSYKNATGGDETFTTTGIPEIVGPYTAIFTDTFASPIVALVNTMDSTGLLPPFITKIGPTTDGTPPMGYKYQPFEFTTNISIKAGSYYPDELSFYISQKLSTQNPKSDDFQNLLQSNFIQTSQQYDNGSIAPDNDPNQLTNPYQTLFIGVDAPYAFTFAPDKNYYIGATQMALQYDQANSRFQWTFTHTPMYDDNGTNICVRFVNRLGNTYDQRPITDNGGVLFTGLSATVDSTGESYDFWNAIMGFDLSTLVINPFFSTGPMMWGKQGWFTGFFSLEGLNYGTSAITGYWGADALVVKQPTTWYSYPSFSTLEAPLCSTITSTTVINAVESTVDLANKFSHYIISCDLNFMTDTYIASEQNYRNFNSIVSKYYAYSSYTYASTDASIIYTHQGPPAQLKDIHIRVLRPDKSLDPLLENDNTVIISIIKAPPQQVKA
jgi:hypothetical protein